MGEFSTPLRYNDRGQRVRDAQWLLGHNFFATDFHPGPVDGIWGKQSGAAADLARYMLGFPESVCKTGRFGQELYLYLLDNAQRVKLPAAYLARRIARLAASKTRQIPPLPGHINFSSREQWPRPATPHGAQPWIEPQILAIQEHFGLTRAVSYGGHPPHTRWSDHMWGGAADFWGSLDAMVRCTFWADGLCSAYYRKGAVFRWVGGPAHDANGPEPGHYSHVHLSWFRSGPATTVFGTPGFPR